MKQVKHLDWIWIAASKFPKSVLLRSIIYECFSLCYTFRNRGDNTRVQLPHPEILEASEVGHHLLVDDGKVRLTVIGKGEGYIDTRVDVPGKISDRKGVNTPDAVIEISALTPKDRSDLKYMVEIGVDWIALSFVQRPEDLVEINKLIDEHLGDDAEFVSNKTEYNVYILFKSLLIVLCYQ